MFDDLYAAFRGVIYVSKRKLLHFFLKTVAKTCEKDLWLNMTSYNKETMQLLTPISVHIRIRC